MNEEVLYWSLRSKVETQIMKFWSVIPVIWWPSYYHVMIIISSHEHHYHKAEKTQHMLWWWWWWLTPGMPFICSWTSRISCLKNVKSRIISRRGWGWQTENNNHENVSGENDIDSLCHPALSERLVVVPAELSVRKPHKQETDESWDIRNVRSKLDQNNKT